MNESSEEEKDDDTGGKDDALNLDTDTLSPGNALNDDVWPENDGRLPGEPG